MDDEQIRCDTHSSPGTDCFGKPTLKACPRPATRFNVKVNYGGLISRADFYYNLCDECFQSLSERGKVRS